MKTEQEILKRIAHIKEDLSDNFVNQARVRELEWILKPNIFEKEKAKLEKRK